MMIIGHILEDDLSLVAKLPQKVNLTVTAAD